MHEGQCHGRNSFITLTYDEANLPADGGLDVREWQLFAKRLRKRVGAFRFFHCGEYGDLRGRPHFHACIFGHNFRESLIRLPNSRGGYEQWTNPVLEAAWSKGRTACGALTFESAAYVARYVTKKQRKEHYEGRAPEYATMSRRPGIGSEWFEKYKEDVYRRDEVIMGGKAMKPPKYYDQLLEREDEEKFRVVKERRIEEMKARERAEDLTADRRRVREEFGRRVDKTFDRSFD